MPEFKFGFEESWFRLIIKKIPLHPDLFQPKAVEKAQTLLRIGKLKVSAARAWAESAGIVCKKKGNFILTSLGKIIANHDPDLEEDGIWWTIHYNLARSHSPAWFYYFYFNEFTLNNFSRPEFETAVRAYWDNNNAKPMTDNVFHKLIFSPFKQVFEGTRLGDDFGFWFIDDNGNYRRNFNKLRSVPSAIFSYALLYWAKEQGRQSVHFEKLLEPGGIGLIFGLDRNELDTLIIDIGEQYQKKVGWISHTAGLNSVSIMNFSPLALISAYYYELDGKDPMTALKLGEKESKQL